MDLGGSKVPMHLPTISRHELTRLAQTGQLEDLLNGIPLTRLLFSLNIRLVGG